MYLMVGLGNPEKKYFNTFHNVGFWCVDELAYQLGVSFDKNECDAKTAHAFVDGVKVIIAKPQTYMNLSGQSVLKLVNKYKIPLENVMIAYDDVDIPLGSLRIRSFGSAGTHNGMRDVVAKLNSEQFARIRIGTGKQTTMALIDFVLSEVSDSDKVELEQPIGNAVEAMTLFAKGLPIDQVMQRCNLKK